MNTTQRIVRNTVSLYAAHILSALMSLALTISIARMLGDTVYGKYSFAYAFTAMFLILLDFGYLTLIVREVARDKSVAPKYLGNIAIIKTISSIAVYGLIAITIYLIDYPRDTTNTVLIFGVFAVLSSFANMFRVTFRAFEQMQLDALMSTIFRLVTVSIGLVFLHTGYGIIHIALAFAIGGAVDLIMSGILCARKCAVPKFEIDLSFWKRATIISLPLVMVGIANEVYTRIDTVMLSVMKGDDVVGWYNAAYNLVLSLKPVVLIFSIAVFPVMARSFISSPDTLKRVYEQVTRYVFIIGLPMAAGIMLLSERIISFLYGYQFTNSSIALQILSWDILLFFIYTVMARVLIAIDRQNKAAIMAVTCAFINVLLNLILIPILSYKGAAIATIATELILLGGYFFFISKHLHTLSFHRFIIKPIISCTIMSLFVYWGHELTMAALIAGGAGVYFCALFALRAFTEDDKVILKQIFSRRISQ